MFKNPVRWFGQEANGELPQSSESGGRSSASDFNEELRVLNSDPYVSLADEQLRLISVFDDLKYDRADADMMSGPMRKRVVEKLKPLGFLQISGGVLENAALNVRMVFPKFRALGASPFDAVRDEEKREQDFFILTPTQTACQLIDGYDTKPAVDAIKALISKHPINLLRIMDYLDKSDRHRSFAGAIGHLKYVQRQAVESEPLCRRRALR